MLRSSRSKKSWFRNQSRIPGLTSESYVFLHVSHFCSSGTLMRPFRIWPASSQLCRIWPRSARARSSGIVWKWSRRDSSVACSAAQRAWIARDCCLIGLECSREDSSEKPVCASRSVVLLSILCCSGLLGEDGCVDSSSDWPYLCRGMSLLVRLGLCVDKTLGRSQQISDGRHIHRV